MPLFSRKKTAPKCRHCVPLRGNRRVLRTPGAGRRPRSLPGFRCPTNRAAVCDFLPLRLCDEMRICYNRPLTSRANAIGHRECGRSFGFVDGTISQHGRGGYHPPANERFALLTRLPRLQTHPSMHKKAFGRTESFFVCFIYFTLRLLP